MRHLVILTAVLISGLYIFGCQSKQQRADGSWPQKMQAVGSDVFALLPYIYSRKEFHAPENEKMIQKKLAHFSESVHDITDELGQKVLGKDPMVKYSLARLQDDVQLARDSYANGHAEYARNLLRGATAHCFRCHSSNQFGPEYTDSSPVFKQLSLDPSEKADIYVATRQYDEALQVLESVLKSPGDFYEHPYEQERAFKRYLALVIRVKEDPLRAIQTIDRFLDRENVPYYLSEDAKQWKKSLSSWSHEKRQSKDALQEAKELLKKAKQLQEYQTHQAANVEYLRASALLHERLKGVGKDQERAEIYFMLGNTYEVLSDLGFWSLPEIYFEACVREVPGQVLAKNCYKSFERNVIWGFSGSAGVFIPSQERARLEELKALAGLSQKDGRKSN